MKRSEASLRTTDDGSDLGPDLENGEFDFTNAVQPGHNDLFERAQGHYFEVSDDENRARVTSREDEDT